MYSITAAQGIQIRDWNLNSTTSLVPPTHYETQPEPAKPVNVMAKPPRSGYTLVEVLVVVAIVAGLAALLLPAVQSARVAARRIGDTNKGKQSGLAVLETADRLGYFPPTGITYESAVAGGGLKLSQWPDSMPGFEQNTMAKAFNSDVPFYDNSIALATPNQDLTNLGLSRKVPDTLALSSLYGSYSYTGQSDLKMVAGTERVTVYDLQNVEGWDSWNRTGGGFQPDYYGVANYVTPPLLPGIGQVDTRPLNLRNPPPTSVVHVADIRDGLSNTYLLSAAKGTPDSGKYVNTTLVGNPTSGDKLVDYWSNPSTGLVTTDNAGARGPNISWDNANDRSAMALNSIVVKADGSASWVSDTINLQVLRAGATRSGNEIIDAGR